MIQGRATLIVDLGNSSTKATVLFGKDSQTGKYRARSFEVPNQFALIDEGYEVSADYSDATSTILRVDTVLNDHKVVGDFCNGELQEKEKPLAVIKPSASSKKYDLDSTVLSYRLALLFGCKAIMNMQRVSDFGALDIEWTVVTLLPPGDIDKGRQPMIDLISSIDRVVSVYPQADIPIKIAKVAVLPEGYCAYAGIVFDVGNVFRPDFKFLIDEQVLVLDIGAGTTDICVISNNTLVQNSKYTITQGGNNVYQLVCRKLMLQGLMLDDGAIKKGVLTGTVKDGSKLISVVEHVNSAKQEVAQKIISEVQNFFELTDIKARSIGYVIICGGGSMSDSKAEDIRPLSESVMNNFRALSPNSSLVDLPTKMVVKELEDGDTVKVEEQISPRELNLLGASILAELL